jgi:hypothetical protein
MGSKKYDGEIPQAGLTLKGGVFYGTTPLGGSSGTNNYTCDCGTVFELVP